MATAWKAMKRLLHITDTHLFADPSADYRGVVTAASLAAVIDASGAASADAVVISGDLCQDESRGGYRILREQLARLTMPIVCLPGNHDDLVFMREELAGSNVQVLGEQRIGGWRLLALDCTVPGAVHGEFGPERLAEIDTWLAAAALPTLVALHHPPIDCGSRWLDGSRLADGEAFLAMLARHSQVRAVLCGHIHQRLDRELGGLRILATPSTCRQFAEQHDNFATDEQPPGWRWILLNGATLETTVARLPQTRIDGVTR